MCSRRVAPHRILGTFQPGSPRASGAKEATSDDGGRVIRHQKVSTGRSTDFGSRLPSDGRVLEKLRLSIRKITVLLRRGAR